MIATVALGEVNVSWKTVAFKKIKFDTRENVGYGTVDIPAQNLPTTGIWLMPNSQVRTAMRSHGFRASDAMCGLRNLAVVALSMVAMCDSRDVSGVVDTIKELLLEENLEIRHNSEWLASMNMHDVLDLTSQFTISRIMDREDFSNRWASHEPISMIEFMYPLLQGMDSVAVEADIELGGSDQLFNNLVGRDLQERKGQRGQMVMTVPLLVGTDGVKKMSQSLDNYISVKDTPEEMFGKTMSIPDDLMGQWFSLAAYLPATEVSEIEKGLASGALHPGETKRRLAREIVTRYWGDGAAATAEAHFDRLFKEHASPDDVATFPLPAEDTVWLPALLSAAGLVSSNSEGRRMVAQGAVKIDGVRLSDDSIARSELVDVVVQVGKRRFVRLVE